MTISPTDTSLASRLAYAVSRYNLPGISVSTIDGDLSETACAGTTDKESSSTVCAETLFPIGSVTKILVATVACLLADRTSFSLDAPVVRYVPELAEIRGGHEITTRMLLSHSSGLSDTWSTVEDLENLLATQHLVSRPGSLYSYSNVGYIILGRIIAYLSGTDWETAAKTELLESAGIALHFESSQSDLTGLRIDEYGSLAETEVWPPASALFSPAGASLRASSPELAKLVLLCATGRTIAGERLIPQHVCDAMQNQQVAYPGFSVRFSGWGLGWGRAKSRPGETSPVLEHTGGTSAFVHVRPDEGFAEAILTNGPLGWAAAEELVHGPAPEFEGTRNPESAEYFLGTYGRSLLTVSVRVDEAGGLWAHSEAFEEPARLQFLGGTSFWADFGTFVSEVNFLGEEHGRAAGMHTALRWLPRA